MSYDIVRSVKVSPDGVVMVKSASNNVWPRTPHEWEMTYRGENNPFKGKRAADAGELRDVETYRLTTVNASNGDPYKVEIVL